MSQSPTRGALAVVFALATLGEAFAQPAFQVKDIRNTADPTSIFAESSSGFVQVGGVTFFTASDGLHGNELWRSDGTAVGTRLVKDLCPGRCASKPTRLTVVGALVYFSAQIDSSGALLWKSDGTEAGTVPVFVPPSPYAGLRFLTPLAELGGILLFQDSGGNLWRTDGTDAGTSPVWSNPSSAVLGFMNRIGGTVLFNASDNTRGRELWRTDGTTAGTALVKDINPGPGDSLPGAINTGVPTGPFPVVAGKMYFGATDGTHDGLWATDGTAAGTLRVSTTTDPVEQLTVVGGELFFVAFDSPDWGIWKSDGTAAGTLVLRGGFSGISELTPAGSRIFFHAAEDFQGEDLWVSDGSPAGTTLVANIGPGSPFDFGLHDDAFAALGDKLVFFADDGTHGPEPWVSDGTAAGTTLLADLDPGAGGSVGPRGTVLAGRWLFAAYAPAGWGLYTSDGTPAGTSLLREIDTQSSSLGVPASFNTFVDHAGKPLFFADDGATGAGLWQSDGTAPGTSAVAALLPTGQAAGLSQLTGLGGEVFFTVSGNSGSTLWRSDGTAAGTQPLPGLPAGFPNFQANPTLTASRLFFVIYFNLGAPSADLWSADALGNGGSLIKSFDQNPEALAVLGNELYVFSSIFTSAGGSLWKSDGATATLVAPGLDLVTSVAAVGPLLFFNSGSKLWKTDGTLAGTVRIRDLRATSLTAAGKRLFFVGLDPADPSHGWQLWASDGTDAGTRRVLDVGPGFVPPDGLTALGDRLFFTADDGVHGRELWVSDGTAGGTHMVADLLPGSGSSRPANVYALGHIVLFAADDGIHGSELWRSDGTAAGTWMVQDIAPGNLDSSPSGFAASGPNVYFAANDGTHGFEPWALPRAGLGGFLTATLTVAGQTWETGTVTYTLTVTNAGAGPALDDLGDEVADVLPAGLTLLSATAGSGTITTDLPGNRVAWNGALDPGASVAITIQAHVGAGTFGNPLANQATLAFDADGDGTSESSGVSDDPGRPGAADATSFSPATAALAFYSLFPCRLLDTRAGTPLASGSARTLGIAGTCGIPAEARALAANLTVVNPSAAGFLTVYPTGTVAPLASTLNFARAQTRTNNAVLSLVGGQLDARAGLPGGGQVDLVIDVVGYFR